MNNSISLIISFYNESKNIHALADEIEKLKKNNKFLKEVILVDNGSKDDTGEILKKICYQNSYTFVHNENSYGYGDGYFSGIKKASSTYILMNHSDLQFSFDIVNEFNVIFESEEIISCFVKRTGRTKISSFKTLIARTLCMIIFRHYVPEVNGQPKLFPKKIFNNISLYPRGYAFDLFIFKLLKKNNIQIKWFYNKELPRLEGVSSWSKSFKNQFYNLLKYLKEANLIKKIVE